jgi:hypothetical protein
MVSKMSIFNFLITANPNLFKMDMKHLWDNCKIQDSWGWTKTEKKDCFKTVLSLELQNCKKNINCRIQNSWGPWGGIKTGRKKNISNFKNSRIKIFYQKRHRSGVKEGKKLYFMTPHPPTHPLR